MTGAIHISRAIAACRRAGLPIVEQDDCTCGLRGRLVVLVAPGPLRVIWPYEQRCPIHSRHDRGRRRPAARAEDVQSWPTAPPEAWAAGEGEAPVIAANPLNPPASHATDRLLATGAAQQRCLSPEPDWHRDRALFGTRRAYELVARPVADDELARARGLGNADREQRLVAEPGRPRRRTEARR